MSNTELGSGGHIEERRLRTALNRCDRGAGSPDPGSTAYHGLHTAGDLVKDALVVQSRGVCMCTGEAGGDGLTYPDDEEEVDRAGLGGLAGGVSDPAAARCMSFSLCPRWVIS